MSRLFEPSLFYLSFLPLWLSILFVDITSIIENEKHLYSEIIGIVIITILLVFSFAILFFQIKCFKKRKHKTKRTIYYAEKDKSLIPSFIFTFALPLCAFDFTLWKDCVLFLIFFVPIVCICIKNNIIFPNIVLLLFKYNFYNCKFENDEKQAIKTVISKSKLDIAKIGDKILVKQINNSMFIEI